MFDVVICTIQVLYPVLKHLFLLFPNAMACAWTMYTVLSHALASLQFPRTPRDFCSHGHIPFPVTDEFLGVLILISLSQAVLFNEIVNTITKIPGFLAFSLRVLENRQFCPLSYKYYNLSYKLCLLIPNTWDIWL